MLRMAQDSAAGKMFYCYRDNNLYESKLLTEAAGLTGRDKKRILMVGNNLSRDILGANRTGLYSILVSPMNPKEEIQIVLKRYLEKPILWAYKRSHPGEPVNTGRGHAGKAGK